jgi:iron complex transport system substrate-binding protein
MRIDNSRFIRAILLGFILFLGSCRSPQNSQIKAQNCDPYDANKDYFPVKVTPQYARGFSIEYYRYYKIVTVKNPWRDAKESFRYILVQCGAPNPPHKPGDRVITIPVRSIVALSTTHLALLNRIGVDDQVVGVSDSRRVNTPSIRQLIDAGKIRDVGNSSTVNIEAMLAISPDLITTFGTGNSQTDSHPKLQAAGLKTAIVGEYMESTPLGRTEWMVFLATFFNAEAKADREFQSIATRYKDIADKNKDRSNRPRILAGFPNNGIWYVPGGDSFVAKFISDAGGDYLWRDDRSTGSQSLSLEQVLERGKNADIWLNGSQNWRSLADVIKGDSRQGKFRPYQTGQIYNSDARLNTNGGNDIWESGLVRPDRVLEDLAIIFHQESATKNLYYYRQLGR